MLAAALDVARMVLDSIIMLDSAYGRVTLQGYAEAADEHLSASAGDYNKAVSLWADFVARFVRAALKGELTFDSTKKVQHIATLACCSCLYRVS
jgi:hypothetical protein